MTNLLTYFTHFGLLGKGRRPGWQGRPPYMMCLNINDREKVVCDAVLLVK